MSDGHAQFPRIVSKKAGDGSFHVVTSADVRRYLGALVEWRDLISTLNTVALTGSNTGVDASYVYDDRTIRLEPWSDLVQRWSHTHVYDHYSILRLLRVPMKGNDDHVVCYFTRTTAHAYTLVHVFMHELGHHRHAMRRNIWKHEKAEKLAEELAVHYEWLIWRRYVQCFGVPDPGEPDWDAILL